MKTLLFTNWTLMGLYALLLIYLSTTLSNSGTDAAGRGLALGYLVIGAILLVAVAGLNLLPFRTSRIGVLLALVVPLVLGARQGIGQFLAGREDEKIERGRADGTYYFPDARRRELAAAMASDDLTRLRNGLQSPLPTLNDSGTDHLTLLDFAALRAAGSDHPEAAIQCLDVLMEHGATLETADSLRVPTSVLVAWQCPAAVLHFFLKKGANPNAKRLEGTPILFTILPHERERLAKLKLLLDYGADPNAPNPDALGDEYVTPLFYAAQQGMWDECLLLLEKGADANYRTPQGIDVRKILVEQGHVLPENADLSEALNALKNDKEQQATPPAL
ncbi:MAG: hypothetical protein H7Y12_11740 [Sphingobacteriaceae bacterium]|nr:hypothetical protein [Cytophagaceae bacterium]